MKRSLILLTLLVTAIACGGSGRGRSSNVLEFIESRSYAQNVQLTTDAVLPPYGVKVVAEASTLQLRVESTADEAAQRLEDVRAFIAHVEARTAEDAHVDFEHVSVGQVVSDYGRESSSGAPLQALDPAVVIVHLTTPLADHDDDFIASLLPFEAFIDALEVSDTLSLEVISVGTALGDVEPHRQAIIAQVYEELDAAQGTYGPAVTYEVTGLYEGLKIMPLSDVEYYLYLTPAVVVTQS